MNKYKIDHIQNPGNSLKFLMLRETENVVSQIRNDQGHMHRSIHEIRKSFKKIRSMLRLIRDEIGYSSYYRENVFYRDLSRSLSGIRTFRQHEACLRYLQKRLPDSFKNGNADRTLVDLSKQRDEYLFTLKEKRIFISISKEIKNAKQRILDFDMAKDDFTLVEPGLKRMYKQGKFYYNKCLDKPSIENLHNLRKRVKYLWYQLLLLKPVFPKMIKASYKNFEILSELIGDHRDFLEFIHFFEQSEYFRFDEKLISEIYGIVEQDNKERLEKSMLLGAKLFFEKPSGFTERIGVYWEVDNIDLPELLNHRRDDPFY